MPVPDPYFMSSDVTIWCADARAAIMEGRPSILIELDANYARLVDQRLNRPIQTGLGI